jgi:3',5'-nucleoside bisphosphate phosphatase
VPKVDLHLHSSISDGVLSPAELIAKAAGLGLTAISLTDHDNVDGIAPALEAASGYPSLTFIPGVEISTDVSDGEVHILGYFVDYTSRELLKFLSSMRDSRLIRTRKILEKLVGLGMKLEWERVREIAGAGTVGRPHIAQALLEKGYISNLREAFAKYLAFGGPAYIPREKISPMEAVELIISANGLPVLAHPLTGGRVDPEKLIGELVKSGLAGLEAYYKDYPAEDRKRLVRLADKYGILTTGGSDYHGLDESAEMMMGDANVPPEVVDKLTALAGKQTLKSTR